MPRTRYTRALRQLEQQAQTRRDRQYAVLLLNLRKAWQAGVSPLPDPCNPNPNSTSIDPVIPVPMYTRARAGTRRLTGATRALLRLLAAERPIGLFTWDMENFDLLGRWGLSRNTMVTPSGVEPELPG